MSGGRRGMVIHLADLLMKGVSALFEFQSSTSDWSQLRLHTTTRFRWGFDVPLVESFFGFFSNVLRIEWKLVFGGIFMWANIDWIWNEMKLLLLLLTAEVASLTLAFFLKFYFFSITGRCCKNHWIRIECAAEHPFSIMCFDVYQQERDERALFWGQKWHSKEVKCFFFLPLLFIYFT